jgi:hypothetical protein
MDVCSMHCHGYAPVSIIISSVLAPPRHNLQRTSTERGMRVDFNVQFPKHDTSIRRGDDLASNVNCPSVASEAHSAEPVLIPPAKLDCG